MTATTNAPRTANIAEASRWPILERALGDRRRSLVGWGIGIAAYVALIVAFWPSIRGSSEITRAIENYPDAMKEFFGGAAAFDYTRPGGFLNTQLFSLILPLLISIFAIGYGASALAGDQHAGKLDIELSLPLPRARIVTEKVLALAVDVIALAIVSGLAIIGVGALVDLRIGVAEVAAACAGAGLIALFYGLVALVVGAAWDRTLALAAGAAAFIVGYLIQALSGLVDGIKPLRWLSPLYHANGTIPINTGFPIGHDLLVIAGCLLLAASAVSLFDHHDIVS